MESQTETTLQPLGNTILACRATAITAQPTGTLWSAILAVSLALHVSNSNQFSPFVLSYIFANEREQDREKEGILETLLPFNVICMYITEFCLR